MDERSEATPGATPAPMTTAPYGISAIRLPPGLTPGQLADLLYGMPEDVAGLPQQRVFSDADSAVVVYAIETGVPTPRFGMAVILIVPPAADADRAVTDLERNRWGDPAEHDVSASGAGGDGEPAFREFSRSFPPGLFLLPYRPVFFLLWYRQHEEYAFMVIGDTPAVREGLARAMAQALQA